MANLDGTDNQEHWYRREGESRTSMPIRSNSTWGYALPAECASQLIRLIDVKEKNGDQNPIWAALYQLLNQPRGDC